MPTKQHTRQICVVAGLCLTLAGCATEQVLKDAQTNFDRGQVEASLQILGKVLASRPTDPQLRATYLSMRDRGLATILIAAEDAQRQGDRASATALYQRVLLIDDANIRAQNNLEVLRREERHADLMAEAKKDLADKKDSAAKETLRRILAENIAHTEARSLLEQLEVRPAKPAGVSKILQALEKTVSIEFKDAMLKQVFEVLSRTTAVNFVFDKDVRTDQKVTVFLNNTSAKEALDVLLFTNQLEQRTLDNNTILIYPNTPTKLKDYQALTVRGFFLANADPESVANALKSLLKMKDVIVDKRQNLITVRDTTDAVRLAEKLITLHDLPEPEVMLEVEILEVNRNRLTELGIKYPSQLTLTPLTAASGGTVTLNDLRNLSASNVGAQLSPAVINARRQTGAVNLLANPRIRVRNRDTAKILIGDKVPNITTTSTATGFVSSNVQYLDVGLKLEVMPTITVDNEIAIKIALEVSNIAGQITTAERTVAYQIGTRSASTVLRLKDGENQVLAGLINDEDRHSANKIPGIGDIPLLGRLFSSQLDEGKKSEIMLSITPRLVRNNLRPGLSVTEFESGTETSMRGLNVATLPAAASAPSPVTSNSPPEPAGKSLELPPAVSALNATTSSPVNTTAKTASVTWDAPSQVKAGDIFTLSVNLNTARSLTAVPLTIGFDPARLEVLSVQEGNLLAQNGGTTSFSQRTDRQSGQVFITAARNAKAADAGASGEGQLVSLTLKAIGVSGATTLRIVTITPLGLHGIGFVASIPPPLRIDVLP